MANVELRTVSELLDKKFIVPLYQRGYRWETQQVRDLLEDIDGFIQNQKTHEKMSKDEGREKSVHAEIDDFYCLQPLAVKETIKNKNVFLNQLPTSLNVDVLFETRKAIDNSVCWEVIDGQQRLTTIFIILQYLDTSIKETSTKRFQIQFERWGKKKSGDDGENANVLSGEISNIAAQLKKDPDYQNGESIDLWHVCNAYKEIVRYFDDGQNGGFDRNSVQFKKKFRDTLLNKVQFIWYESDENNPIKIFTRLNIGKIALTNSELIKALFLNRSNFVDSDFEKIRLRQTEIATRWDEIEAMLQNDEFWMFIHSPGFDKPTRIDFIFDLVCEMGLLGDNFNDEKEKGERIGKDQYRTFRYFNEYFHSEKAAKMACENHITLIEQCWQTIDSVFAAFREWFDDLKFYHYIGFLVACDRKGCKIEDILGLWQKGRGTKGEFIRGLMDKIKECVKDCKDLGKQYETEDGNNPKTICRPVLLLHNIQTVINQNARCGGRKGGQNAVYKFPFHLYKSEGWDVEHIDSNSENDLADWGTQCEFLLNRFLSVSDKLREQIKAFINSEVHKPFNELKTQTDTELGEGGGEDQLGTEEKNQIWNFALLDSSTNRSYGNAIFSAKRRIIISKDRGRPLAIPRIIQRDKKNVLDVGATVAAGTESVFIPPCTRYAFFKYYSPVLSSPNYWRKPDAQAYREDIFETLKDFGITIPQEDNGHE